MIDALEPTTVAALAAVRAACRVCRAVASGAIEAVTKADDSPVTIADFAAQAVVLHALQQAGALTQLVGEESAGELRRDARLAQAVLAAARVAWTDATVDDVLDAIDAGAQRPAAAPYWTLDPIDGTKGFLRRGQYAVCLAEVEGTTAVRGVMGCPNLAPDASIPPDVVDAGGTLFVADRHGPALQLGLDDGSVVTLPTVAGALAEPVLVTHSVESGHTRVDRVASVLASLGRPHRSMPCDSQAKYAMVARGQAHAYLRIPTNPERVEMVWDHAAGVALATRTGMCVTDLRGRPFDFHSPAGLRDNFGILCVHPQLHAPLLAALAAGA